LLMIRCKKRYMTLIVCSALVIFPSPQWRRLDTMCEMFQMGTHTLCWYGGRFCLQALSGINRPTVLFTVYILCIYNFLYFVTILGAFCANYHLPTLGTCVHLSRGGEAFRKKNFTHIFLWLCPCNKCLFIKQIKLFLCSKKFYISSQSITAV
jgi:hypothetical protein